MKNNTTKEVELIGSLNFEGNIIPHEWFNHIKFANGKTDINSIIILSEIVYWYRPTIVKDEYTGAVIGMEKKFKADLLQRSYDSFSQQFGLTKGQVTTAVKRLEEFGVLERVFRNIFVGGQAVSNVLFIKLNAEKVIEITNPNTPSTLIKGEGYDAKRIATNKESETYTEITTKNSPEKERYTLEQVNGGDVISYYNMKYMLHFNKPHPTITKEQMEYIEYNIGEVTGVQDLVDEDWRNIIDEHFDSIDDEAKARANYFFSGNGTQGVAVRYIKQMY